MAMLHTEHAFPFAVAFTLLMVSSVVVGCSLTDVPALDRARTSYEQAQQNEQLNAHAPIAIYEAEIALRRAEHAWERNEDREEVEHLAYIAEKKLKIARATARQTMAEAQIQQLAAERETVILEARSREAEQARQGEEARAREAERARREAQEARAQAKKLEQLIAELRAVQTERGLVINLGDVLFESAKADLKPGAIRNVSLLAAFLKEYPKRSVLIEGHTDNVGSESYNLALSQRRADAVRNFLIQNGISPKRIIARGYGEAYPVTSNEIEVGRQQNRRVEVVILREGESTVQRKGSSN